MSSSSRSNSPRPGSVAAADTSPRLVVRLQHPAPTPTPAPGSGPEMNANGNGHASSAAVSPSISRAPSPSEARPTPGPGPTPASASASTPTPIVVAGKTHRKVSCELCHRRKIKCDQGRPSCGSCVRKGKVCVYFDEGEGPGMNGAVGGSGGLAPASRPGGASAKASKSGSPKEKRNQRERILGGFDSDSDDNVDGALAELVKDEEIDELESDSEHAEPAPVMKRGVSEELNGELLELVSGPPRSKKPRTSIVPPIPYPTPVQIPTPISAAPRPIKAKLPPARIPQAYAMTPYQALLISLPGPDILHILLNTFFTDPFLSEGISLLQPQFMEDLKSVTERQIEMPITLGCTFAFLATALRIMPEETSRLLLASAQTIQPRSLSRLLAPNPSPDTTPLDQRYVDLAGMAAGLAEHEPPSVMTVMLKLVLYRYMIIRKDRVMLASQHLAGAIKIAQALGMGKEWEGIPQPERELRRRVMWSLYIADRQFAFDTAFPYTILDAHHGIHLPSPISEAELYQLPIDATHLPPHDTEDGPTPCTGFFIQTHLARRLTPILDSFATLSPACTPHELALRADDSLDNFQDALPPYMRLFPTTDSQFDSEHPYLLPHRLRLHATLFSYRHGIHRSFTLRYLRPSAPEGVRTAIAQTSLMALRTQRSFRMLDPKVTPRFFSAQIVFESAALLALVLFVDKSLSKKPMDDHTSFRGGVAEGIELLDNIADIEAVYARRAVKVVRELAAKVDSVRRPKIAETEDKPGPGMEGVLKWLDGLPKSLHMDVLLRDPQWEGAWEIVLAGMMVPKREVLGGMGGLGAL